MIVDASTSRRYVPILGKTGDETYQVPTLDASTRAFPVLEYEHHEIHAGNTFTIYFANTTAGTATQRTGLYIKTPLGPREIHMIFSGSASLASQLSLHEAPTLTADAGTGGVAIYNRDRNSSETSIVFDNAASPAVNKFTTLVEADINGGSWNAGTTLRSFPLVAGSGPKPVGGDKRGEQEYILKFNTSYVLMLTGLTSTATNHLLLMDWYEHTPKEA